MDRRRLFPVIAFSILFVSLIGMLVYGLFFASDPRVAPSVLTQRKASDFSVESLFGGTIDTTRLRGKLVVLNFWASWCPPCKEEAVILERAYRKYGDRGVAFVGVAMGDTLEDARKAAVDFGKTFPLANDLPGGKISLEYGVAGVPETFFIDRNFTIKEKVAGPVEYAEIETFLESEP